MKKDYIIKKNGLYHGDKNITKILPTCMQEFIKVDKDVTLRDIFKMLNKHKEFFSTLFFGHYCKEYISKKYKISANSISVVYNFVTEKPNQLAILEEKLANDTINIVYSGGGAPSKSPDLVIKVLAKLLETDLDFKFYWVGSLTPPFKKIQLFNSFAELVKTDHRVEFLGKVPRQEAEDIIAKSNVFFAPSRREGCPMALLEAMRIGAISVVSDYNIANKELIEHDYDGFIVDHTDIASVVDTLEMIILNHKQLEYMYDNSARKFKDKLSFKVWKDQMDSIIYSKGDMILVKRGNNFDYKKYMFQRFQLSIQMVYNKYALIFTEYLPCAWTVFKEYLKVRITNFIKKK